MQGYCLLNLYAKNILVYITIKIKTFFLYRKLQRMKLEIYNKISRKCVKPNIYSCLECNICFYCNIKDMTAIYLFRDRKY